MKIDVFLFQSDNRTKEMSAFFSALTTWGWIKRNDR